VTHDHPSDGAAHHDDEVHSATADAHEEPALEEPKTPLWLTALGGGLFFLLAVAFLAGLASEPSSGEPAPAASASVAAPAPPPPAPKASPSPPPPLPPPAPPPIAAPPALLAPPPAAPGAAGAKNVKKPAK